MARQQTRRTVSMNRALYEHLKQWAADRSLSAAFVAETAIAAHVGFDLDQLERVVLAAPSCAGEAVDNMVRLAKTGVFTAPEIAASVGMKYGLVLRLSKRFGLKLPHASKGRRRTRREAA